MSSIIDTNHDTTAKLGTLRQLGIETIIRYDNRLSPNGEKQIKIPEVHAIAAAGLKLGIVYEGAGNLISQFSGPLGTLDASYALRRAEERQQPAGSAEYFAVDGDFTRFEIANFITPYFTAVAKMFDGSGVKVGVYGSGQTCAMMAGAGLADLTWVSCSTGWTGSIDFLKGGKWSLRQHLPEIIGGLDTDPNDSNPALPDFGAFGPAQSHPSPPTDPVVYTVTARNGLRLRAQPNGSILRTLVYGTRVSIKSNADGWAAVDVDMDGTPEGYVSTAYLARA